MRKKSLKKWIGLLIPALCMFAALVVCLRLNTADAITKLRFVVPTAAGDQAIAPHVTDDGCFAFLPSYADLAAVSLDCPDALRVTVDGKAIGEAGTLAAFADDAPHTLRLERPHGWFGTETALTVYQAENIPALSVALADGTLDNIHNSPGHKVSKAGKCAMIRADGSVDYAGALDSLQGRGNVTWEENKRPYNIRFKKNVDLLGMGAGEKYCLLANALDKSNLRDKLVYDAAQQLGLPGSVDSAFVDLYVDGEYRGLYLLTEDVQVRADRIDVADLAAATAAVNANPLSNYTQIDETKNGVRRRYTAAHDPADVTGGYLIELDMPERFRLFNAGFILPGDEYCYTLRAPERATEAELDYVCNLFTKIENDLEAGVIPERIDLDSWVKYYLVQEVFANFDPCSVYFFKDTDSVDGKIYAGPIWDFDKALGSPVYEGTGSPNRLYAAEHTIFQKMYADPLFAEKAREVYRAECVPLLQTLLGGQIEAEAVQITRSAQMNAKRWQGEAVHAWEVKLDSVDAHVKYVADFLRQRKSYLDILWCGAKGRTVDYVSYAPVQYIGFATLAGGGDLGELPALSCDGYEFLGWFDADGNAYDPLSPVADGAFYTAKWKQTSSSRSLSALVGKLSDFAENHNWTLEKLWNYAAAAAMTAAFFLLLAFLAFWGCRERRRTRKHDE